MRICADCLRLTTRLTACFSAGVLAVLCGNAWAATENVWQGASGGAWATGANWSLGHAPTASECAVLPDTGADYTISVSGTHLIGALQVTARAGDGVKSVTLGGSGLISNETSVAAHRIGANRRLVLDGATVAFDYNGPNIDHGHISVDGELVLANASSMVSTYAIDLVGRGAKMSMTAGSVNLIYLTYRNRNVVQIDGGSASIYSVLRTDDDAVPFYDRCLAYVQNGGQSSNKRSRFSPYSSLTVAGGTYICRDGYAEFADGSTLTVSGGTLQFNCAPSIDECTTLSLTGGAILVNDAVCAGGAASLAAFSRLVAESSGTFFSAEVNNSCLLDLGERAWVGTLRHTSGSAESVLKASTVVFSSAYPFYNTGSGPNRYFRIEGPTTIRPTADMDDMGGREVYPFATGDITVDTRDWNDPSVTRTVKLSLGVKDAASLTVMGGGTMELKPTKGTGKYDWDGARAFSSVIVSNNATLTIPSVATSGNYIPLVTESLTLGPGATLNVSAGEGNGVYAANWSIDPTAHINVTVLDTFTTGATPILVDTGSDAIADFTGRITLSGATSGAVLKRAGGNIVLVKKTVTEADGTYQYEWVSSSSSYKWRNTGSWYCKAAPPTSGTRYPIVFGAVDKYTTSNYNMTDTTPTIVQLVFRDTAVSSFTVANDATKPLSFQKYNASDSGTANASIYSLSAVPQYINCNARTTSNNRFSLYAADSGPVVFGGGIEAAGAKAQTEAAVHVCGDIRTTGTISHRMLAFTKRPAKPDMSRLFVESGTVAFTNQVAAFDVTNAGFRVATGAMLTFDGRLASAFYQWTAVPQKIVVDGSMRIDAVVKGGGARQLYGGSGTLVISQTMQPSTGATPLEFSDTLSVTLPATWQTVASTGADAPLTLAARGGRPVLHVANGWTYGPASGVATTTAASDRAAYIHEGATLAIDANGGTATFEDPVAGPGKLEIASGTLSVPGGISSETSLKVASGATFAWSAATAVAGLEAASGATLRVVDATKPLVVSGAVDLTGVTIDVTGAGTPTASNALRILSAAAIVGQPTVVGAQGIVQVVTGADGTATLEIARPRKGVIIMIGGGAAGGGNAFDFTAASGAACRLTSEGSGMWRIRTSADGTFPDVGAAQALAAWMGEPAPSVSQTLTATETSEGWTLDAADGTRAVVAANGSSVKFLSSTGREVVRVTHLAPSANGSVLAGSLAEAEAVYGLGERLDRLNKRGQRVSLFAIDGYDDSTTTYTAVPLFSTTRGGGVFVNAYEPIVADMGATSASEWAMEIDKASIDAYVIATDRMRDVPARYMALTGRPAAHDAWHFGSVICRQRPDFSQMEGPFAQTLNGYLTLGQGLKTIVDAYDVLGALPSAVIAFGRDVDVYSASARDTFAEAQTYLAGKGVKYMVYMAAGSVISKNATGFKGEYLANAQVSDAAGNVLAAHAKDIPDVTLNAGNPDVSGVGTRQVLDITNPDAWNWYMESVWQPLLDNGVRGAMVDFCEMMPDDGVLYGNVRVTYNWKNPSVFAGAAVHHAYPTFFTAKLQRDLDARLAAMDGSRFLIHARGGGIGAQRATFLWAGDQKRAFAKLDDQLLAMLNSGVSGVPFMTYDMAGYQYTAARQTVVAVQNDATGTVDTTRTTPGQGESAVYRRMSGDTSAAVEQTIFSRAAAFTAYSPCMRQNGYVRQAFEFDAATANIYATYAGVHASLTNAIAAAAHTAAQTGVPVVRPLAFDYQDDANTWDIEDEYLFCDNYLVAPVLTDATSREVYLPEGTWRELDTGTVRTAPASGLRLTLSVPVDSIPVFVRE